MGISSTTPSSSSFSSPSNTPTGSPSWSSTTTNTHSSTNSPSVSQSNSPSVSDPNALSESVTPIVPPVLASSGVSIIPTVCGNGKLEAGEQCDPGTAIPRTQCCTTFCTSLPVGAICGPAAKLCLTRPKCAKTLASRQLVCKPGKPKRIGTKCGKGGLFSRRTCRAGAICK